MTNKHCNLYTELNFHAQSCATFMGQNGSNENVTRNIMRNVHRSNEYENENGRMKMKMKQNMKFKHENERHIMKEWKVLVHRESQ